MPLLQLFILQSLHTGSRPSMKDTRNYIILKEEEEENFFERKRSVLLPVLEDSERVFHELVASGDVSATKMFLQNCPDFNINCVNYQVLHGPDSCINIIILPAFKLLFSFQKISALHVAVKQQNEDMVEFLLEQRGLDISDCGLYAIKGGNIRIVEMIFNKIRERYPRLEFAGSTHR